MQKNSFFIVIFLGFQGVMYRKYIKIFNIEAIKLEMFKLVKNKVFTVSQDTTLLHSGTFYRTKKSCFVAKI